MDWSGRSVRVIVSARRSRFPARVLLTSPNPEITGTYGDASETVVTIGQKTSAIFSNCMRAPASLEIADCPSVWSSDRSQGARPRSREALDFPDHFVPSFTKLYFAVKSKRGALAFCPFCNSFQP